MYANLRNQFAGFYSFKVNLSQEHQLRGFPLKQSNTTTKNVLKVAFYKWIKFIDQEIDTV